MLDHVQGHVGQLSVDRQINVSRRTPGTRVPGVSVFEGQEVTRRREKESGAKDRPPGNPQTNTPASDVVGPAARVFLGEVDDNWRETGRGAAVRAADRRPLPGAGETRLFQGPCRGPADGDRRLPTHSPRGAPRVGRARLGGRGGAGVRFGLPGYADSARPKRPGSERCEDRRRRHPQRQRLRSRPTRRESLSVPVDQPPPPPDARAGDREAAAVRARCRLLGAPPGGVRPDPAGSGFPTACATAAPAAGERE